MAPTKFINFLAVVSFAVFYISLTPLSANALAVERVHVARNPNYAHAGIAKKKRGESAKRCKPRPSTSSHSPQPTYTPPPTTSHHSSSSSSSSSTTKPHPPPTSPTSTSYASVATPHTSSRTGKVGLAWSNNEQSAICHFKTGQTGFTYNWKLTKYVDVDVSKCGFKFIPHVWGADDAYKAPGILVAGYADIVFTFNEPELSSQSSLGVDEAVSLFMQYVNPLQHLGYQIISPACTNSPTGFGWIQSFVKKCRQKGGKLDGIATHFYDTSAQNLINFMENFIKAFPGDEIWLTEYAAQDYSGKNHQLDYNGIKGFIEETTNYLKGKSEIRAYFYFGAMTPDELAANHVNGLNSLMTDSHTPNELGNIYIN
ncbi:glycosyl hydrolase catalytic core-domain-containing protein [Lactarius akahatsu]|uniref:Glycosyl hydrolase catalytic core-domain-containing protein n=1 Tax=Lactarius akahatsu TaxID=416441 RepID=A0AAD4LSZ2_9AGAM|nr:glycosyl hydrolase catalytic core-domain-containing protein [Lactarius akahatsu]